MEAVNLLSSNKYTEKQIVSIFYLVDLEYVETRYTAQLKTEFPPALADKTVTDVTIIEGLLSLFLLV